MTRAPNQPPEQVRAAAAVVQKWLDEQQKPGAGASPPVPEMSAAERFDRHRQLQLERSRADETNLRKVRS
ncbi:MAG: hypothetical protein ACLPTZ_13675 [Beijerinckiaceae bacterium]